MGRTTRTGQHAVASEDEGMFEETRAPSTSPPNDAPDAGSGVVADLDYLSPAVDDDEELLSVASHSSEEELESINAAARLRDLDDSDEDDQLDAKLKRQMGRKRSHPAGSFSSSSDDDEISGILGVNGGSVASGGSGNVALVQFSAAPPVDLPIPVVEASVGPSPAKTLHFQNGAAVPSAWTNSPMAIDEDGNGVGQHDDGRPRRQLRQNTNDPHARQVARLPRPFLDFDKMRQKAEHALTTWKHGNELTLACR